MTTLKSGQRRLSRWLATTMAGTTAAAILLVAGAVDAQIRPPLGGAGVGAAPTSAPPAPRPGGLLGSQPAFQQQNNFVSAQEKTLGQQASGNYPVIQRSSTLPIGAIQKRWNSPKASTGQTAPGIMRYVWRPDFVMPVRTREFMTTTLELPAWEQIERIILGDTMVFEASRVKRNIMVVRPTNAGADTNMTVIGSSGNIYNFYLRSEGWNSNQITDFTVYVNAAGGPGSNIRGGSDLDSNMGSGSMDSMLSTARNKAPGGKSDRPEYLRNIAFDPSKLKFDMKIYAQNPSDIEIAPERVFNDGIWTYFDFGTKSDVVKRPIVLQVIDGVDTLVNTRTVGDTGNILVAEAIGNFTLRNGRRVICVYRDSAPLSFPVDVVKARPTPYVRAEDNREPTFWEELFGTDEEEGDPDERRGYSATGFDTQLKVQGQTQAPVYSSSRDSSSGLSPYASTSAVIMPEMQASIATKPLAPTVEYGTRKPAIVSPLPEAPKIGEAMLDIEPVTITPSTVRPAPSATVTRPTISGPISADPWAPDQFVTTVR